MDTKINKFDTKLLSYLGCGCEINRVAFPRSIEEFVELVKAEKGDIGIFGGLTNTLVVNDDKKLYVCTKELLGKFINNNEEILALAGERLSSLYRFALSNSLAGLEALESIPGTLGGAIKNNSGCYGVTISDLVVEVFVYDTIKGELQSLGYDELGFGYRKSNINDTCIVLMARLKLTTDDPKMIQERVERYRLLRKESQPKGRSLGSIFKQVNGVSAGYYIEKLGLKGKIIDGILISEKHANFFINLSGDEKSYYRLIKYVENKALDELGIKLEREVVIIE